MSDVHWKLGQHMRDLHVGVASWQEEADRILADPQAHIEALVEAGVLTKKGPAQIPFGDNGMWESLTTVYALAPSHKHSWYVSEARCTCGETHVLDDDYHIPVSSPRFP